MLLYISHALRMSLGLELDLQLFRKRAVLKTDPLCSNIARRAGMQPVFFYSREVVSYVDETRQVDEGLSFLGRTKFRSFPDLPFMNLSWVVLRLDEWYICPDPAFSTLTKQDAPSIQDTVRLVSLDWTSRNKHQPISSLAARTEFR